MHWSQWVHGEMTGNVLVSQDVVVVAAATTVAGAVLRLLQIVGQHFFVLHVLFFQC